MVLQCKFPIALFDLSWSGILLQTKNGIEISTLVLLLLLSATPSCLHHYCQTVEGEDHNAEDHGKVNFELSALLSSHGAAHWELPFWCVHSPAFLRHHRNFYNYNYSVANNNSKFSIKSNQNRINF